MLEIGLPALILVLIGMFWHASLGARENARMHARMLCSRARLQLLDQTVVLKRIRPARQPGEGWMLIRDYGFDVSSDGNNRLPARLRLSGTQLSSWSLPAQAEGPASGSLSTT